MSATQRPDDLLTPAEVGAMFRVDPRSVNRWAKQGRISAIRTPGGHRRYRRDVIDALLRGQMPRTPALPWLTPGTPSTWICLRGHVNPRTTTACGGCA